MAKYRVRDYTMEQKGFPAEEYMSKLFNTYREALKEISHREQTDKNLGIQDEYYIEEIDENV